jgi:hydroxypyruvate reductase
MTLSNFPDKPTRETLRALALEIFRAGLAAADPAEAVGRCLSQDTLLSSFLRQPRITCFRRVLLVGAGKAAGAMAAAVVERLGDRIDDGCIVVPHRAAISLRVRVVHGSHPLPDEEAMRGAAEILSLAENADERDLVIVVLSGGGSALLPLPVEGVSLNDLRRTTDALLRAGADVYELNTVRKHLSRIQGGRLARAAVPATIVTLVLSDVAGNQLDVVGSGPTHPDPTTFAAAWDALSKYGLAEEPRPDGVNEVAGCEETPLEAARIAPPGRAVKPRRDPSRIPAAVLAHLQRGLRGEIEETPKPGDAAFARAHSCVVADNRIALEAMRRHGESQGLSTFVLDDPVRGEAREAGAALGRMLHTSHDATGLEVADPAGRTICVLFGGETTVTVRGGGRGGRNQELAVGAALELAAAPDPGSVVLLAAGTDGIDGNSEAAGGLVDGTTIMRAERIGLDPHEALDRNDCTPFLGALGDLVVTGPTGTNVMDVGVGVVWRGRSPGPQAT